MARFPRWFYPHDLGQGVVVQPTDSPRGKTDPARFRAKHAPYWNAILRGVGGSLEGLRVLDAGCFEGYWSVEAARAGASEAIGFDLRPEHVEQARFVARAAGLPNVRFEVADLYALDRWGPFDVVFLFGVLYHVDRPVELLRLARSVTRRLVAVNTVILPLDEPVLQVRYEDPGMELNAAGDMLVMVPTPSAVVRMLRHAGFRNVRMIRPAPDGNEAYLKWQRAVFLAEPAPEGEREGPPADVLASMEGRQGEPMLRRMESAASHASLGGILRRKIGRWLGGDRPPRIEAPLE